MKSFSFVLSGPNDQIDCPCPVEELIDRVETRVGGLVHLPMPADTFSTCRLSHLAQPALRLNLYS